MSSTPWSDIGLFVSLCCASLATVIYSIQKSKCTTIQCGCIQCDRKVTDAVDPTEDLEAAVAPPEPSLSSLASLSPSSVRDRVTELERRASR